MAHKREKSAKSVKTRRSKTKSDSEERFQKKYSFFEDVFEVAKLIPRGRVTSYGAIAAYLGLRSSARMVGWAMNAVDADMKVPAHRVVNSQGLLTGKHHFVPPSAMEARLKKEGVKVVKDKIVDFQKHFWDPMKEL